MGGIGLPAQGAEKYWLGTVDQRFETSGNWSPAGMPVAGDTALFAVGAVVDPLRRSVYLSQDTFNSGAVFSAGDTEILLFDGLGQDPDPPSRTWTLSDSLQVGGRYAPVQVALTNGTVNVGYGIYVGYTTWGYERAQQSTLNLDAATLDTAGYVSVGPTGTVSLDNGSQLSSLYTPGNGNASGHIYVDQGGQLLVSGGSSVQASRLSVAGTLIVDDTSSLAVPSVYMSGDGSYVSLPTLTGIPGGINFNGFRDSTLEIRDDVRIGKGTDSLGQYNVNLVEGTLRVDGTTTIGLGWTLAINGGTFSTGSLVRNGSLRFNSGTLEMINDSVVFADGADPRQGFLGKTFVLDGSKTLSVAATFVGSGGSLIIDGGTLSTVDVDVSGSGNFQFNSGTLELREALLTVGNGGLLGNGVVLGSGRHLRVMDDPTRAYVGGITTIDAGASLVVDGGSFATEQLVNNGNFQFNAGSFELTNSSLTIGTGGLLGNAVTLGADRSLGVSGTTTVAAGASLVINGGTLKTGQINRQGTFQFNSGTLELTNSSLLIGAGGLLGSNVNLDSNRRLIVSAVSNGIGLTAGSSLTMSGGYIDVDSVEIEGGATVTVNDGEFRTDGIINAGTLNINGGRASLLNGGFLTAGSRIALSGGELYMGRGLLSTGGTLQFTGGSLVWDDSLGIGAGGLYGNSVALTSGKSLTVTGTTTIAAGGTLTVDGGSFVTGSLVRNGTLNFVSGSIDVGYTPLSVGSGGLLGQSATLSSGQFIRTNGQLTIAAGGSLTLDGGHLSAARVVSSGTLNFNQGHLELREFGLTVGGASPGFLGSSVNLGTGKHLSVVGVSVQNAGSLAINGGTLTVSSGVNVTTGGSFQFNTGLLEINTLEVSTSASQAILGANVALDDDRMVAARQINVYSGGTLAVDDAALRIEYLFIGTGGQFIGTGATTIDGRVRNQGEIFAGLGSEIIYLGLVEGSGSFTGQGIHTFLGGSSPGNSPARVEIEGSTRFGADGDLLIEMAGNQPGTEFDVWDVGGEAFLDGILTVAFLEDFAPLIGDSFDILFAEVIHGTFAYTMLPGLDPGMAWDLQYLLDDNGTDVVRLSVTQVVPVPAAVWLFGGALGLLGAIRRRAGSQRLH